LGAWVWLAELDADPATDPAWVWLAELDADPATDPKGAVTLANFSVPQG